MDFSGGISEWAEISEGGDSGKREISQASLDKFDRLMGDDKIQAQYWETREYQPKLTPDEREEKFTQLFEERDFFRINPGSFGWKWSSYHSESYASICSCSIQARSVCMWL